MLTGDGWLARLALPDGVTPVQLAGLAAAASRFGNGLIEPGPEAYPIGTQSHWFSSLRNGACPRIYSEQRLRS
jgi:hypothetical protein